MTENYKHIRFKKFSFIFRNPSQKNYEEHFIDFDGSFPYIPLHSRAASLRNFSVNAFFSFCLFSFH